jgi:two-component system, NarL family, sensor histidine kinase DesK
MIAGMTAVLTGTRERPVGLPCAPQQRSEVGLAVLSRSDRMARLVPFAPVAATLVIVAVQWSFTFMSAVDPLVPALLLAGYLPPHLHHLWATAHARRPRFGGTTLAAMAVIYVVGVAVAGPQWYMMAAQLLASVLLVLRPPWSVLVVPVIMVGATWLHAAFAPDPSTGWFAISLLDRGGAPLVLAWFAGALHQLRAARTDLTTQAVLRERLRIDEELTQTVGTELRAIAAGATAVRDADSATAERELRALVDGSRRTLAAARRMIRGYQRVPLRAELDTAVALLDAAGIATTLTVPRGELTSDELTGALRSAVDRLLHDDTVRAATITVARQSDRLRLTVTANGTELVATEVVA